MIMDVIWYVQLWYNWGFNFFIIGTWCEIRQGRRGFKHKNTRNGIAKAVSKLKNNKDYNKILIIWATNKGFAMLEFRFLWVWISTLNITFGIPRPCKNSRYRMLLIRWNLQRDPAAWILPPFCAYPLLCRLSWQRCLPPKGLEFEDYCPTPVAALVRRLSSFHPLEVHCNSYSWSACILHQSKLSTPTVKINIIELTRMNWMPIQ